MGRYVQFYHLSTGYVRGTVPPKFNGPREPIPACGSDGVMYVDGRFGTWRMVQEARDTCRQRGYIGFSIHAGPYRMNDGRTIRPYEPVTPT